MRRIPAMLTRILKSLGLVLATGLLCAADSMPVDGPSSLPATESAGLLLVLPGVGNTRFHLDGFVTRARQQLPGFTVVVRPWGVPLMTLHNLRAHERNLEVARDIADEIASWRRDHPAAPIYLVGYSGGGGMAVLAVAALAADISIDRLVLVAPAISPDYPVADVLLPKVDEFVVNYASERDLQVGWGTRTFGTIDRVVSDSAGAVGFTADHERLVQWHWSPNARASGHWGNHVAYLGRRWQQAYLLPALDPRLSAAQLCAIWE